jgi:hypothetical protein
MPVVEAGDRVEVAYRVDDVRASLFGSYFGDQIFFQRPDLLPVYRSRVTLIAPDDLHLRIRERNGAPLHERRAGDEPGTTARVWEMRELPRIERESFMPPISEFTPVVEVTTYDSWNDFAEWWWSLVEREFTMSDRMRELVASIVASTDSKLERIREVYEYVVSQIRYVAWEFGIHGYQPYSASTIFARKFGDCKDKAILMATLLEDLGIPSYPVVLLADAQKGNQDLTTPLIEHFNHCILYVPLEPGWEEDAAGRGLFLDGTAQFNDWRSLPTADRGGDVLIVKERTADVAEIPDADPDRNGLDFDERVRILPDGSADIRGTVRARGTVAAQVRSLFLNAGDREEQIASRFAPHFGRVEVRSMRFSDFQDLNAPVEYSYEVHVPSFLTRRGNDFTAPILFSAPSYSDYTGLQERKFDLLLPSLHSWNARVEFEIVPPLEASHYFDDAELSSDFSEFRLQTEERGNVFVVEASLVTRERRVPAERYEEFREYSRRVDQALREVIHFDL